MKKPTKKTAKVKSAKKRALPAKPKLQKLGPALAPLVDAATRKPLGPAPAKLEADILKLKGGLTPKERRRLLKLAPRPDNTRWPSEIIVGKRFRKEFRKLDEMARSIETLVNAGKPGLLQPIGITPKDELIWGERRLMGWKRSAVALTHPIPVRAYDIGAIIVGEYIENDPQLRDNFTPEEAVDIVRAMTAKQREMAAAEQATRPSETRSAPGRKAAPGAASGRVMDRAAAFTGRSRPTLDKSAALVDAAAEDPQRFGGLLADANRTKKVDGPFKRLQVMRATDAIRNAPPVMPNNGPYETAVFDFPWPHEPDMDQEQLDAAGRSLRPYPAMSIKAGAHFLREEVAPKLAKRCTVYFWTTGFHMAWAYQLLAALGFTDPCVVATWVHDKIGRGRVFRNQGDFCIVMHRGGAVIAHTDDTTVWQGEGWERRDNSRKPEAFYRLVERKSPAQRYLSVWSTGGEGDLWDAYGDQVGKHAAAAGDEREEWKALGAVEADVAIAGPVFTDLQARALVAGDAGRANGWTLTEAGADRLAELEAKFKKPARAPTPQKPNEAPRPEALSEQERQLFAILNTVAANPAYEVNEAGQWLASELESLIKRGAGGYRRKPKTTLTAKGKKRLEALRALVDAAPDASAPVIAAAETFDAMTPEPGSELAALSDIAAGGQVKHPLKIITQLIGFGYVVGKKKPRITKFGERRLTLLRSLAAGSDVTAATLANPADRASLAFKISTCGEACAPDGHKFATWIDQGLEAGTCECGFECRALMKDAVSIENDVLAHWADVATRTVVVDAAPDDAPYRIDDALIEAVGKIGGHTVSMQTDPETGGHLAKCPCGAEFRAPRAAGSYSQVERAIEAHWRDVVAAASPAGGDGFPEIPKCLVIDQAGGEAA